MNGRKWTKHGFLSTPSARRATYGVGRSQQGRNISIHALREEGDVVNGGDFVRGQQFLSTPSARRATDRAENARRCKGISIHALREEGDRWFSEGDGCESISIHALREEGDCFPAVRPRLAYNFYPRPPRGGRLGKVEGDFLFS